MRVPTLKEAAGRDAARGPKPRWWPRGAICNIYPLVAMTDQLLSQGLVAYVGTPGRSDGKSPEDRVVEVAGDAAPDLLPRVEVIMNELHTANRHYGKTPRSPKSSGGLRRG